MQHGGSEQVVGSAWDGVTVAPGHVGQRKAGGSWVTGEGGTGGAVLGGPSGEGDAGEGDAGSSGEGDSGDVGVGAMLSKKRKGQLLAEFKSVVSALILSASSNSFDLLRLIYSCVCLNF